MATSATPVTEKPAGTRSVEAGLLSVETGPRSIPKIEFIENLEEFLKTHDFDETARSLHQLHCKFQIMERSLSAQKRALANKIPDISDALDSIELLKRKKNEPITTHFMLSDNIIAKAEVPPTDSVFLWLGANTLLEYPLNEADEMLKNNKSNAESAIVELNTGLEHLRVQLTTTEVNMARLHNYGVTLRKQQQDAKQQLSA